MNRAFLEFQFLIGSLKTQHATRRIQRPSRFQFLIGSLKTWVTIIPTGSDTLVSIPHRQSKNVILSEVKDVYLGFQFLIGSLKTRL